MNVVDIENKKSKGQDPEMLTQLVERMGDLKMGVMITTLMAPILMKDVKKNDPEAFYTAKAKLKELRQCLSEGLNAIDKAMKEDFT